MKKPAPHPMYRTLRRAPLAAAIWLAAQSPAFADQHPPEERALDVVTVTAQKRSENLQEVPISIQVLDGEALDEFNVLDFNDVIDQLPAVTLRRDGEVPGNMQVYMRGVVSGGDGNHSASLPSVGVYLDEQPITTIRGPMDIHMADIERIEALAGPQGTLYGASSQAGTLRIITNKPDPSGFAAGYSAELNTVHNGGDGNVADAFVNLPLGDSAAVRLVGWSRDDAGYIDNVHGSRVMPTSGLVSDNAHLARKDFNDGDVVGARAALRLIFGDDWTVTPQVMGQKQHVHGSFGVDRNVGELATVQYNPQTSEDSWVQAALTVQGRIGNFDITYAFANLSRDFDTQSDYNDYAFWYDTLAGYGAYFYADNGELVNPNQYIRARNHYTKRSHELRLASPAENPLRFVGGVFWQKQHNDIEERYLVDGIASDIEVPGWPDTIWLTVQDRDDEDKAVFGELAYDFNDRFTGTVGVRKYWVDNSLSGFFGYGAGFSSGTGEAACFDPAPFDGAPCTNLDKSVKESDWLGKANLSWKVNEALMVYATWSEGFRPGGINRRGTLPSRRHQPARHAAAVSFRLPDQLRTRLEIRRARRFGHVQRRGVPAELGRLPVPDPRPERPDRNQERQPGPHSRHGSRPELVARLQLAARRRHRLLRREADRELLRLRRCRRHAGHGLRRSGSAEGRAPADHREVQGQSARALQLRRRQLLGLRAGRALARRPSPFGPARLRRRHPRRHGGLRTVRLFRRFQAQQLEGGFLRQEPVRRTRRTVQVHPMPGSDLRRTDLRRSRTAAHHRLAVLAGVLKHRGTKESHRARRPSGRRCRFRHSLRGVGGKQAGQPDWCAVDSRKRKSP